MTKPRYGLTALLAILALRIGIGCHFFSEGLTKLRDPKPFSSYFLLAAKGPWAAEFRAMVWDPDGLQRLGYRPGEGNDFPSSDYEPTQKFWEDYAKKVARVYKFDKKQKAKADEVLATHIRSLQQFHANYEAEIVEYFQSVERRDRNRKKIADRELTETLWGQAQDWETEVAGKRGPLLSQIDALWAMVEKDLNAIATKKQAKRGPVEIGKIGRRTLDSETIDQYIPWFDCTIGVLLILGLLTRVSALAAAAFLASVIATQWPWAFGAVATWPQLIEMLGLLTLAAVGAGRVGGLDYLIGVCWRRKMRRQEQES